MNSFSNILKHKKIIFFVFLFFVALGFVFFSQINHARGEIIGLPAGLGETPIDPHALEGPAPEKTDFNPGKFLGICIALAIFLLIAAYTFAVLAILMAVRYAMLAVLFILAPLAFTFWIFPATKKMWTKWWEEFIKWAIMGVSVTFFIHLALKVLESAKGKIDFNVLFVVFVFLIVGYKIARSGSQMVTGGVIGLATGAAGLAIGAVKVGAKMAGKGIDAASNGKISATGRQLSRGVGLRLEAMGLRNKGQTDLGSRNVMKDSEARSGAMNIEDASASATGNARTTDSKRVKLANIQRLVKSGDIDKLGPDAKTQNEAVTWAENHAKSLGGDASKLREDASKLNPNLGITPAGIRAATRKVAPSKAAAWSPDVVTPDVLLGLQKNQITEIGKNGSPELVGKIKSYQDRDSNEFKAMRDNITRTTAPNSAERAQAKREAIKKRNQVLSDGNYFDQETVVRGSKQPPQKPTAKDPGIPKGWTQGGRSAT